MIPFHGQNDTSHQDGGTTKPTYSLRGGHDWPVGQIWNTWMKFTRSIINLDFEKLLDRLPMFLEQTKTLTIFFHLKIPIARCVLTISTHT